MPASDFSMKGDIVLTDRFIRVPFHLMFSEVPYVKGDMIL